MAPLTVTNLKTEYRDDGWYKGWYTFWTEPDGFASQGFKTNHSKDEAVEHLRVVHKWLHENRSRPAGNTG